MLIALVATPWADYTSSCRQQSQHMLPCGNPQFPNHNIMHGAGKMGLTSLCNLDLIPPKGSIIIALPLKIENGSGSPVRVIAIK